MTFARSLLVVASLALAACGAPATQDVTSRLAAPGMALPPMKTFSVANPFPAERSNADMARDFMEMAFFMESGRPIPRLARFEGPITLRMTGPVPPGAEAELARLLDRFRREAGLTVTRVPATAAAGITVEFVSRAAMRAAVPSAACFVVPRVSDWDGFRRARRGTTLDWTTLDRREQVAVFIPYDVTPQEVRDCLHEEVAQAMGPLNDLYRLPDTVFNDDNFQTVLTGFDMLLLRVFNDPALQSGMTPEQVAARLPSILARLNPRGERIASAGPTSRSPRAWVDAIETALGVGTSRTARRTAAETALSIARAQGWQDARLAFSHFTLARMARSSEAEFALRHLLRAGEIYRALPGGAAHAAHVDMQLSAFALSAGRTDEALALSVRAQTAARRSENAALLSSLQMVQAEALDRLGRPDEARLVRNDALGWARFGFGSEDRVRARLAEVASLGSPVPVLSAQAGALQRGYME